MTRLQSFSSFGLALLAVLAGFLVGIVSVVLLVVGALPFLAGCKGVALCGELGQLALSRSRRVFPPSQPRA